MAFIIAVLRHLKYLVLHKVYVLRAGLRLGVPLKQLVIHDWSKFLPSEFLPYTRYHFMGKHEENKAAFEHAFVLHYIRNPHHWEHWQGFLMPNRFVLEMVADWEGSAISKRGLSARDYYLANKGRIVLAASVRSLVEQTLGIGEPMCHICAGVLAENVALIAGEHGITNRVEVWQYLSRKHFEERHVQ